MYLHVLGCSHKFVFCGGILLNVVASAVYLGHVYSAQTWMTQTIFLG